MHNRVNIFIIVLIRYGSVPKDSGLEKNGTENRWDGKFRLCSPGSKKKT